jgi:hypothetical protein
MMRERCESGGPAGVLGPLAASRLLTDAPFGIGSVAAPCPKPDAARQDTQGVRVAAGAQFHALSMAHLAGRRARFTQHAG